MDREKLHRLLRLGIEKGASDIHFQVGYLPLYRFHGELVELRYKVLTPKDTEEITRILLEGDPGAVLAASLKRSGPTLVEVPVMDSRTVQSARVGGLVREGVRQTLGPRVLSWLKRWR